MGVTEKLVELFQVDKQLRGLRSRLTGAEKFLSQQTGELAQLNQKRATLEAQLKQLQAQAGNLEGEKKTIDEKIAKLRSQLDAATTNKQYQAFLTEINTFKADSDRLETQALESMTKADEVRKQLAEIDAKRGEREQVKTVAAADRDKRAEEIKDRLEELKVKRDTLAKDISPDVLRDFERLVHVRGDEAMAAVEVHDAKRHEYHCGACQMSLPIDAVSGLMSSGRLTKCVSCQCLLYLEAETLKAITPGAKKEPRTRKAKEAHKEEV